MPEHAEFDAVVVGAGPAGASAALALARAGRRVVLVERGPFPGSKNVYGGVVYGRVLDDIVPGWWEEVPVERWIVRRSTMMMTGTQSLSVDFRTDAWGSAPYNGMTTLRCHFDTWLASKATDAGAHLLTSTVATGLVRDGAGRVVGVVTDRAGAELRAPVVIACDGVNSFLAKEAGLLPRAEASHHTLGVKEVLDLPPATINERFGVQDHEGVDMEILGCTREIPGGGFLYTNADSVSIGVVLSLPELASSGVRPEALIADLKAHPAIAPLLRGSALREYAAHLIPEGGYDTMPALAADGLLIAGDAGAMTLAAGLWLEGVNFAIGSGYAAGRAADRALARGDCSAAGLASYRADLEGQFVLADHKRLRRAPALVLSDRVQRRYPGLLCDLAEGMFTVTNPTPKPGGLALTRSVAARHGVKLRQLAGDTLRGLRIFG
ncbi:MAG TPA: FAD-dependent oxidoreductase [Acidimicrobiales bacterium]|nr:FAD-dependent oxidoreductase [Acidimicrobiales bacterium]